MAPLPCLYFSLGISLLPRQLKKDGFFCCSLYLAQSKDSVLLQEITHCLLVSDFWLGDLLPDLSAWSEFRAEPQHRMPRTECGAGGQAQKGVQGSGEKPRCASGVLHVGLRDNSLPQGRGDSVMIWKASVCTLLFLRRENHGHPSRVWWYLPLTPTLVRLRTENCEFKSQP